MISAAHPSILKRQPQFLSNFIKLSILHTCARLFGLPPPGAAIPLHQLATPPYPSPSTLLGFSVPHTTPPPPQMTSRSTFTHTCTCTPVFGPTTPQSHQLSTFLGIFGVPPSHYPLPCQFLSTYCSPTAAEPLKTLSIWGVTSLFSSLLTFVDIFVHHGWGAIIIPFCGGPMLHALHVRPIPTTFLLAYAGILFTHS